MSKNKARTPNGAKPGTRVPASPELKRLWDRVARNPHLYRLVDLDSRTTWAFEVRDGKLVPVVELPCKGPETIFNTRTEK